MVEQAQSDVADTTMQEAATDASPVPPVQEDSSAHAITEDQETRTLPRVLSKDRTLKEFLSMMDQYAPIIPDAVTDYYLELAGFECQDRRVKRLLALAAQKFIADIAQDAYQYSKIRANSGNAVGAPGVPTIPRGRYGKERGRAVLTMDDLGSAVHEYGINLKRQDFMR